MLSNLQLLEVNNGVEDGCNAGKCPASSPVIRYPRHVQIWQNLYLPQNHKGIQNPIEEERYSWQKLEDKLPQRHLLLLGLLKQVIDLLVLEEPLEYAEQFTGVG